ncbi:coiled-coil domain-containing protein [Candidatus Methanoperedens nitratireducens]|uniref:Uncharacterized protein n=1 Tax=Candidatus Methanoperedens nitratireducens TaxID=1392998 RepID=A0A284VKL5_9EURY|nr:hypothetical protein [Candidatus Methanoperedens nitroreducens]SNQ59805.1 hypothetical protein MNV_1360007 [Candidatus Methanoperedens nitroreducens]
MDTKICEICNETVDTRGYGNHLIACKRKQNQVKSEAKSLNHLREEVKPSELEAKVSEIVTKSSEIEAKIDEIEAKSSELEEKVSDITVLHQEDIEAMHQEAREISTTEEITDDVPDETPEDNGSSWASGFDTVFKVLAVIILAFVGFFFVLPWIIKRFIKTDTQRLKDAFDCINKASSEADNPGTLKASVAKCASKTL